MDYSDVVSRTKVPSKFSVIGRCGITSNATDCMIDNTPFTGFKIRLTGGSYDSPVRMEIVDPRGFSVSGTVEILNQILLTMTIRDSEILDECVWSFNTPLQPRLLSTSSPVYQIVTNTCKITPGKLKSGNVVKIVGNKNDLVYWGKVFPVKNSSYYRRTPEFKTDTHHLFFEKENRNILYVERSPTIFSMIEEGTPSKITLSDINTLLRSSSARNYYYGDSRVVADSKKSEFVVGDPTEKLNPEKCSFSYDYYRKDKATLNLNDGTSVITEKNQIRDLLCGYSLTLGRVSIGLRDVQSIETPHYRLTMPDGTVYYV